MSEADKIRDITSRFRQRTYKNAPPEAVQQVNEWRLKFADTGTYRINKNGHLCYLKYTDKGGTTEVPICNFAAHMTREILEDDGFERRLFFEIAGVVDGHYILPAAKVSAAQFVSMAWVIEQWGARANIEPVRSAKEKLRHTLQTTSQYVPQEVIYTHTGWREINGKWVYLHGNGAIGAENASVNLGAGMERYTLPPVSDEVVAANVALKTLEVAEPVVTYPLLALVGLAPLCEPMRQEGDEPAFIVWLTGHSGEGKSTLAALFLSFFGTFKSGLSLPASFKDTANAIEKKAHDLKDCLLVVDDYHPTATRKEAQRMEQIAQLLLRGFGDRIGRTRMNADGTLKSSYVPKGMCLISGEDDPQAGTSTTARIFKIEMKKGSVDKAKLKEARAEAYQYSEAMTGYLQWLALQMDELPARLHEMFEEVREKVAQDDYHGRMSGAIACLYIGFSMLCEYLESVGAIDENKRFWLCENSLLYFRQTANRQAQEMAAENPAAENPAEQFVTALQELFSAHQVHTKRIGFDPEPIGNGQFIGWHDDKFFYLLPETVYSVVSQFYERQGRKLPVSIKTLWKHLDDAEMIESKKSGDRIYRTLEKRITNEKKRVLFLYRNVLRGDEDLDCCKSSD